MDSLRRSEVFCTVVSSNPFHQLIPVGTNTQRRHLATFPVRRKHIRLCRDTTRGKSSLHTCSDKRVMQLSKPSPFAHYQNMPAPTTCSDLIGQTVICLCGRPKKTGAHLFKMAFFDFPTLCPSLFNQREKSNVSVIDSDSLVDQQREYDLWVRIYRRTFACASVQYFTEYRLKN